ncbi:PSD1 and planctomycete cytochrome C domain-containing protein [Rubinisphaera margarita]|uniref:PSD1 and planctomycete cytochrome C domain-containing protein n=1 Tax=Rubinisphaera margarita TaxID=2909586 RepID=UPI001EE7D585|nr:PSD1 and planctomycete cytochrome C domain-containing protein [Rubinisphaera margarita]MCG6158268.1 PSD1 and planctomycete cytochrome C domain-containing protein [Rubinisphaera margarita]
MISKRPPLHPGLVLLIIVLSGAPLPADDLSPEDVTFFENRIRPALVKHCYSCHSADAEDLGGGLRLDTHAGVRTGGVSGPALIPGDPDKSLIVRALRYDGTEMPPEEPLPEPVIKDFAEWIRRNAPDPRVESPEQATAPPIESDLWSLQPVVEPPVPDVAAADWPRNEIDQFILARIEQEGLAPTQDAEPRVLARRLYFDLVGLPPTMEQIDGFVTQFSEHGPSAVADLVDELLASPQYGERWGRHWLDVARYGESNGNDGLGRNPTFPHAWRYRDYVIESFNNDVPYNQFVKEQLAGDLLPAESPDERDRYLIATGLLAMSAKPAKAMNNNFAMDVVADQIDVVGRGLMGISIACARCHDHKFDPIPTRDYYAMAGLFTSSETMWGVAGHEKLTAPPTDLHVLKAAPNALPPEDFVETVVLLESNTGKPKEIPKSKWEPGTPLAMGLKDQKEPADCKININGESNKLGEAVPRGFLSVCDFGEPEEFTIAPDTSGRLQLAEWVTDPRNPLTARVIVNRVWQHLFGEGIVRTPDDFGTYGERPTHPELLDHLAIHLMKNGWSMKSLIRQIVLTRTYQLSSLAESQFIKADEENKLLARHNRRRLNAEALRDSMLLASGQIDLTPPEGSLIRHRDILVNLAGNLHEPSDHRSIYLCYLRNSPPPELAAFNLPEFIAVTGKRDRSTVPGQSLFLFNSPFVIEQSEHLAATVLKDNSQSDARVRQIFRRILSREPTSKEHSQALELVRFSESEENNESKAWATLCQALLMTNEFRYVD